MCKIMEDMRIESLKEGALRMLAAGKYALEEIASISGRSLDEVKKLKAERTLLRKKLMAFIDFLGDFPPFFRQVQKSVFIHCKETSIPQYTYRMADAWLAEAHVPGEVYGTHHTYFLL